MDIPDLDMSGCFRRSVVFRSLYVSVVEFGRYVDVLEIEKTR